MIGKLPTHCPCCNQCLMITQLHCESCGTNLLGSFVPPFNQLSEEEQLFIKIFVLHSGSLKSVAQQMKISYPTIRKILNQIISEIE